MKGQKNSVHKEGEEDDRKERKEYNITAAV